MGKVTQASINQARIQQADKAAQAYLRANQANKPQSGLFSPMKMMANFGAKMKASIMNSGERKSNFTEFPSRQQPGIEPHVLGNGERQNKPSNESLIAKYNTFSRNQLSTNEAIKFIFSPAYVQALQAKSEQLMGTKLETPPQNWPKSRQIEFLQNQGAPIEIKATRQYGEIARFDAGLHSDSGFNNHLNEQSMRNFKYGYLNYPNGLGLPGGLKGFTLTGGLTRALVAKAENMGFEISVPPRLHFEGNPSDTKAYEQHLTAQTEMQIQSIGEQVSSQGGALYQQNVFKDQPIYNIMDLS